MNIFLVAFIIATTGALALNALHYVFVAALIALMGAIPRPSVSMPILLGIGCSLLLISQANQTLASKQLLEQFWQKPLKITLDIDSVLHDTPRSQTVVVRVISDHGKPFPDKLKIARYSDHRFVPGDRCTLHVSIKPIRGYRNPGGRDFVAGWTTKGITAQGYTIEKNPIECRLQSPIRRMIYQYREEANQRIIHHLSESSTRQLLSALAVGTKTLDNHTRDVMQRTGTAHLLAISGLHVGLVAIIIFWLMHPVSRSFVIVKWADSSRIISLCISLIAVFIYIHLTGNAISSQRAGWMYFFGVALLIFEFRPTALSLLLSVMTLMICVNPFVVLDIGFWLSCGMVLVLIVICGFVVKSKRGMIETIRLQWRLSYVTFPLTLLLIKQASWVSPIANLIAIPVVSFCVVPLLLLFDLMLLIWPMCASACLSLAGWITGWLWQILSWLSDRSDVWEQSFQSPLMMICLILSVCLLLFPFGLCARALGVYFLGLVLLQTPERPSDNHAWITWLDVGQGLSTVIQTKHHTLVYDTGPQYDDFDVASVTLIPFLKRAGVRTIDVLVVSHADNDHRGGVAHVLDTFQVNDMRVGQRLPDIQRNQTVCHHDHSWTWDGVLFEQFAVRGEFTASNNHSCVLKITVNHQSVLLLGDLEKEGEEALLSSPHVLKADVISVPHHGSQTSSIQALLDAVDPDYAVFSTGFLNRYHHPHPSVIKRYKAMGVTMLDTAERGAIRINL